jgi:hypothetical protein
MLGSPDGSFKIVRYAARSQDFLGADLAALVGGTGERRCHPLLPSCSHILRRRISNHRQAPHVITTAPYICATRSNRRAAPVLFHGTREDFTKILDDFL